MVCRSLFILVCLALHTGLAVACTCAGPNQARNMREVAEWYANNPSTVLIFEGKVVAQSRAKQNTDVLSVSGTGEHRIVEMAATNVFRGEHMDHFSILTGLGGGDCGFGFETGMSYLVFASRAEDGSWYTSICSGTQELGDAGPTLRYLKNEEPTSDDLLSPQEHTKHYIETVLPKRTGSVCGVVLSPDGTPLQGADVELGQVRNDEFPPESVSDPKTSSKNGHFCIEHAPPGPYVLTVEKQDYNHAARYMSYYPGAAAREQATVLNIKAGVRLTDVVVKTIREPLFTLRVHVTKPDGTPLPRTDCCGVLVTNKKIDPLSYQESFTLEANSISTFRSIPNGVYRVETYFVPDYDDDLPKPPEEANQWKAAVREVKVSGNTEIDIRLEPKD